MKAYVIPFRPGACLAVGNSKGYQIKGPIIYSPNQGAIFFESSITGDGFDVFGIAP